MPKNINRIDHVVGLVRPENLESSIAKMSVALQTAFYGPYQRDDVGIRIAVSWDAGVELITPLSMDASNPFAASLASHGERWISVVFGVRDLKATCARLMNLGHEPLAAFSGLTGVEPWVERFQRIDEATFDPALFGGLPMALATVEERSADA